jgi:hypothetical protein
LKKIYVLPGLPSNEKNSSDRHNSYNKGPKLAFFSFTESPSNSLPTIKFPKNHTASSLSQQYAQNNNMPRIWPLRSLGDNAILFEDENMTEFEDENVTHRVTMSN